MATVLFGSLILCAFVFVSTNARDAMHRHRRSMTLLNRVLLLSGSTVLMIGVSLFLGSVAYRFDFNQHLEIHWQLRAGVIFATVGLAMTSFAMRRIRK